MITCAITCQTFFGNYFSAMSAPHYLPEIPGELFFGISGNNDLLHYLSEIFGNLICSSFGAHSW